jgi:hypothetical protein
MMVAGFKAGLAGPDKFGNTASPGLLGHRQTWAFFIGKLMTDGIWWFYLFWLPDYLVKQFNMKIHDTMWPTFIVYGVAIIGSVYGGSIPMTLMKRGMPVYQARMTAMFIIALCPLAVLTTQYFGNVEHFGDMAESLCRRRHLHRRRRASGLVGKSLHDRFRHVSQNRRRLRHRHRRDGRRPRRRDRAIDRRHAHRHLQGNSFNGLPDHVCHLRLELSDRVGRDEIARAAPQTHHRHLKFSPKKRPVEVLTSTG